MDSKDKISVGLNFNEKYERWTVKVGIRNGKARYIPSFEDIYRQIRAYRTAERLNNPDHPEPDLLFRGFLLACLGPKAKMWEDLRVDFMIPDRSGLPDKPKIQCIITDMEFDGEGRQTKLWFYIHCYNPNRTYIPSLRDWWEMLTALRVCEKVKYFYVSDPLAMPREWVMDCFKKPIEPFEVLRQRYSIPNRKARTS